MIESVRTMAIEGIRMTYRLVKDGCFFKSSKPSLAFSIYSSCKRPYSDLPVNQTMQTAYEKQCTRISLTMGKKVPALTKNGRGGI